MTAPISRNNPTRLYKGSQAQINTGEYRPYGMGKKGNVYIQNNYYGPQHPRGWAHDAWANMDHCCEDSGSSGFGEVLGWVGVGMSALGGVLDLFGVGKKGSTGSQPAQSAKAQDNGDATRAGNDAVAEGDSSAKAADAAENPEGATRTSSDNKAQDEGAAKEGDDTGEGDPGNAQSWDDHDVRVYDTSGKTADINGKLKVTREAKANSKFPEEFQTTTASGYTYKYENTGRTDANNQPIYKCVSETVNGKTRSISSGNEYACQLDANGNPKFEFEQNEQTGKDGFGKGV